MAVREGRSIFSNIEKSGTIFAFKQHRRNSDRIFGYYVRLVVTAYRYTALWVNLVTDSLPAISLGLDTPDSDIMDKPPRSPKKGLFADGLWLTIIFEGLMIGALALWHSP